MYITQPNIYNIRHLPVTVRLALLIKLYQKVGKVCLGPKCHTSSELIVDSVALWDY